MKLFPNVFPQFSLVQEAVSLRAESLLPSPQNARFPQIPPFFLILIPDCFVCVTFTDVLGQTSAVYMSSLLNPLSCWHLVFPHLCWGLGRRLGVLLAGTRNHKPMQENRKAALASVVQSTCEADVGWPCLSDV